MAARAVLGVVSNQAEAHNDGHLVVQSMKPYLMAEVSLHELTFFSCPHDPCSHICLTLSSQGLGSRGAWTLCGLYKLCLFFAIFVFT